MNEGYYWYRGPTWTTWHMVYVDRRGVMSGHSETFGAPETVKGIMAGTLVGPIKCPQFKHYSSVSETSIYKLHEELIPAIITGAQESPQDEPQQKAPADGLAERVDRLERQVGVLQEIALSWRRG